MVDFGCNSVENSEYAGGKFANGKVDFDYTGIAQNPYAGGEFVNGAVDFGCNSVESNEYGWFYLKDGKVDFSYNGLASNQNGEWMIENGAVTFNYTGAYMDAEGKGHVVENSKVNNELVADIDYLNAKQNTAQYFDYSDKIAEQMKAYPVNPEAARSNIASRTMRNGASGWLYLSGHFFIFQTVFCATSATIVSGAMAERTKFPHTVSTVF